MAMNKQRKSSNLLNILNYDDAGNIVLRDYSQTIRYNWNGTIHAFTGPLSISSIAAAVTDTDRFLVSDGGVLKYRTGAEVLSDIGAFILPSLTSGSVLFSNGTTIAQNNANFFWDAANARLGIGTNVPATPLHIVGNSTFDGNNNHLINRNSAYYNTSDIVTNFEKVTIGWVSNVFNIDFSRGGSTSFRDVQLSVGGSGLLIRGSGSNIAGRITASYATNVGGVFGVTGSVTGTGSSFQYGSGVLTTISAGGTVPTSAFWISPYVASLGTGFNALLDVGTNSAANGGGTHTRYFAVLNNGNAILQAGGTFTDSGQRLQVQGTALITGNTEISAGNLSIFTTNTPRRLNIEQALGGVAAAIGLYAGGGTLNSVIGIDNEATKSLQLATTGNLIFYSGSTIGNIVTTPTNERMRLTSGGNLLVGTTTDAGEKLQVNGNIYITSGVVYGASSYSDAAVNKGMSFVGTNVLFNNGGERMRLDNAGNLGLGVTPSAWSGLSGKVLEVGTAFGDKAALFQNDIDDLRLMSNVYFDGSFRYVRTGTATIFHSINGSYRWSTAPSGTAGNAISFTQAMTLTGGGNLLVGTTTDAGQKFQVSGTSYFSGNVGIGTTSPTAKLEINGPSGFPGVWIRGGGDYGGLGKGSYRTSDTGGVNYYDFGRDNAVSGNFVLTFNGGTPLLSISSTGAATFSSSVTATNYLMNRGGGQWNIIPSSGANYLYFQENTGNKDIMTLDGVNQRVGIGTTSPSYKLVVRGESSTHQKLAITRVASDVAALFLGSNSSEQGMIAANSADLLFGTDISNTFTERLRITSGGNLLVGTTADQGYRVQITSASADSQLNVWGATAPSIRLDNAASGATQRFVIGLATATNNFIQGANAGDVCMTPGTSSALVFGMWQTSSSSEVMRISTSSNVLIGTSTDVGAKLRVVGDISASVDLRLTRTGTSPAIILDQTQLRLVNQTSGFGIGLNVEQDIIRFGGAIRTNPPAGSGNPEYKLGSYSATAPTATGYLNIEVGGVVYKVLAST